MTDDELSEVIVSAICAASDRVGGGPDGGWTAFEHGSCITDLAGLSGGEDCYYDRPAIGLQYALWYHPSRTADLVRLLLPLIAAKGRAQRPLHLIDLGAGTGATATAARIALERLSVAGAPTPEVRLEALESSPFMLDMFNAIEGELASTLPTDDLKVNTHQRSWFSPKVSSRTIELDEPHIIASYTFDHSDRDLNATLARRLRQMADRVGAESLHLLGPRPKRDILEELVKNLKADLRESSPWEPCDVVAGDFAPTASLEPLAMRRRRLADGYEAAQPLLRRAPGWDNPWLWRAGLRRAPSQLFPPEPLLFGFALDELQEEAAAPDHGGTPRPTAIVGAAGSGKSYVLMERAARILQQGADQRILVTAFNVAMVDELARILQLRLPELELNRESGDSGLWCDRSNGDSPHTSRVVLCNRDKLPTRIFDMRFDGPLIIVASDAGAEGERFFWGKTLFEWQTYKNHARTGVGRGQQLMESQRRQLWDAFWAEGKDSFTHRRIATLKAVRDRAALANQRFTHVLVDECQDFTEADYELLRHLIDDPSGLVVAGDEAQSLHLGGTYRRPTLKRADGSTTVWKTHRLEGSYRLPVAACRAVAPLATHVAQLVSGSGGSADDLTIPEPRKAASFGPRPIVLHEQEVPRELPRILHHYKRVGEIESVCITDGSKALRDTIGELVVLAGLRVEKENMRKIKGLERKMVIVSAQASYHHDDETAAQCFYTAMTRATEVSIIVLPEEPTDALQDALKVLHPSRFLPWTNTSAAAMNRLFAG
jgi:hypothetical protein